MTARAARPAAETDRAEASPPVRPLYRNRDFMVLWTSQVVSTVGTRVSGIAYPLLVLAITGSPAQAGVVGFAQSLPFLLLFIPAGAFVDRWDRRRIMLVCEFGRALALGSVAVAVAAGRVTLAQLIVVAFVEGSLFVFFDLCEGAALPRLVAAEQLPAAIAQNQARTQGADLVGQPLGGALFGLGRAFPFVFDALSYVVSFVALLTIRVRFQEARTAAAGSLRAEIGEGVRTTWRQPFLRASIVVVAGQNFAWNALVLVLIVRAQEFGAGPALIGLMFALFGAGAIAGAVVAPWVQARVGVRTLIVAIAWSWAVLCLLLAAAPNVLAIGLIAATVSIAGPIFNVALSSVVYSIVPNRLLGRVRSVTKTVSWGALPFGTLAGGLLATAYGAQIAIVVLAAVLALTAAIATLARGMREVPEPS